MKGQEKKRGGSPLSLRVMAVLFATIIVALGILDACWPRRTFSELENRNLATDPVFTFEKLWKNQYTLEYEEYVGDQFVLRDQWISLKSRIESLFGKLENNGVIYGSDGYQFEKLDPVDGEQVDKFMGYLNQFAQKLDVPFYFGIIPNAYQVLSDKVPQAAPLPDQAPWVEKIYQQAPENGVTLDMIQGLGEHRDEEIFYHTDHHWTTLGAYYGYRVFCQAAGLEPVALEEMEKHQVEGFYGTLYSKSKLYSTQPETIDYYDTDPLTMEIRTLEGIQVTHSLYDLEQFEKRDKYAAFLYSNNDLTVITRENQDAPRQRLLIIKDSYSNSMIPFLTENYNQIYVVDLRSLSLPMSQILEETSFDDVLFLYNFKNFVTDTNLIRLTW